MNSLDSSGEGAIDVQSFKTGKRKTLVRPGAYGRYLPSGHMVYIHRGLFSPRRWMRHAWS